MYSSIVTAAYEHVLSPLGLFFFKIRPVLVFIGISSLLGLELGFGDCRNQRKRIIGVIIHRPVAGRLL